MRILFCKEWFSEGWRWEGLAPLLPGHEILTCAREAVIDHLDGVDIIVPFWATLGKEIVEKGQFGLIQQFGVGLEAVDIQTATEKGIWVARLPGAGTNGEAVAEHAILLMLALSRSLPSAQHLLATRTGWGRPVGSALLGKTVCIIGLGDIGTALALRLQNFGMTLIGVRKNPARELPQGIQFQQIYPATELALALQQADYTIICVNYNQESHHLINREQLAAMKPQSYLINIARGGLIDHTALEEALSSGHLAGAGLDVFWQEPVDPQHPLFKQNVIATPHIAGITDTFYHEGGKLFAANITRYMKGEMLQYLANQPPHPRRQLYS
ncbi:2-hydroxyacid dehydrogenase [Tengunoibacter tsumagoiensis]|uniref:Uncharacterized protein n=1 Tax=Tengunoibacter tsumagoiensis TaxID=2014871 RepID=A0A402A9N6_9CHLR|nr:2-hydroxyacid dehydrogenase [Tengunoibacter tsumagoiensis]GCE15887.1 hypothetical protein KTT_57460 [Tengunoibacter tsumagoiensis]